MNDWMVLASLTAPVDLLPPVGQSSPEDQQPITKGLTFIGDKEFSR